MTWLQELLDNTLFQAFLAIIAIVGFAYGFIFQRINKEKKEFSFCLKSNTLIRKKQSKFEKLSISYDGQAIEDLCISKFTVWNSGNKTLNKSDMVESKELTIHTKNNSEILDVSLIACSEETNKFSLSMIDKSNVKILFDYADKKEGVVVQVIHTGTDDDLCIDCKIKGGKPIKNTINNTPSKVIQKLIGKELFEKVSIVSTGIVISAMFILAIICAISIFNTDLQSVLFAPSISTVENTKEAMYSAIAMSVTLFISSITIGLVYIPLIKKVFNMGIPRTLKKYFDFSN